MNPDDIQWGEQAPRSVVEIVQTFEGRAKGGPGRHRSRLSALGVVGLRPVAKRVGFTLEALLAYGRKMTINGKIGTIITICHLDKFIDNFLFILRR